MDDQQAWQRINQLFDELSVLPEPEREQRLAAEPAAIRQSVEELLSNAGEAEQFLPDSLINPDEVLSIFNAQKNGGNAFADGQVLLDRFGILELLGTGGMGQVYKAFDRHLNIHVAIKTIRPDLADKPDIVAQFRQEVLRAREVTHLNVCRIHDLFSVRINRIERAFFTMEFLGRNTLSSAIGKQPMPLAQARNVAIQLADGLAAAHKQGVLHRDFKSANVMLVENDGETRAVITDFGIAGRLRESDRQTGPTTGVPGGTIEYMAPEVMEGNKCTKASDVYALGIVLYEMLTGEIPFARTPLKRLSTSPTSPSKLVPTIPNDWSQTVLLCIEKDPGLRLNSAPDVRRLIEGNTTDRLAVRTRLKLQHAPTRRKMIAAAAASAGVLSFGTIYWLRGKKTSGIIGERKTETLFLLPEFRSATDSEFATAARGLLSLSLEQSRYLRQISRIEDARAAEPTALISASVERQDSGYQIHIEVKETSGSRTTNLDERCASERDLARSIDSLTPAIRRFLGEPEEALARDRVRLEEATTSDPDALRAFLAGLRAFTAFEAASAENHLRSAVAADSNFAMAQLYLALLYSAQRQEQKALPVVLDAWRLRSKLSTRQRRQMQTVYFVVTGDYDRALQGYQLLVDDYPTDPNLRRSYAHLLEVCGRTDGLQHAQAAVTFGPSAPSTHVVLASAWNAQNRPDDCLKVLADARGRKLPPDSLVLPEGLAWLAKHDLPKARAAFEKYASRAEMRSPGRLYLSRCTLLSGRLATACEELEADLAADLFNKDLPRAMVRRYQLAQLRAVLGSKREAQSYLMELAGSPAEPASAFALRAAALVACQLRDPSPLPAIQQKLRTIERQSASSEVILDSGRGTQGNTRISGFLAQCEGIAMQLHGDPGARKRLREAHSFWPDLASEWTLAEHLREASEYAEALALYEKVHARKGWALRWEDTVLWLLSLAAAGTCAHKAGNTKKAVACLDQFLGYWPPESCSIAKFAAAERHSL